MSNSSGAKNHIPVQQKYERVVLLVDMDCFYCQVEEKLDPSLKGQPMAVVQYNAWRGGGIIAVNYAARAKGVTRHMRGDEAKVQCPDIQLVKVPNVREKADLSKYRDAGKEVANVLQRYTPLLERASVDEAYLDISHAVNKRLDEMNAGSFVLHPSELHNTYSVGYENIGAYIGEITSRFASPYANDDQYHCAHDANDVPSVRKSDIRLLIGASLASEIRAAVKQITGYECSAGIAHNKILAKLACGMNKPNKQTILPLSQIPILFETLPISKIKGLGAKYGDELCEKLGISYVGQLMKFTEAELQRKFDEKNGTWLYNIARGIDLEAVTPRFYSKSIGCCKKFPGRNNITGLNTLQHWLGELANEIIDRLDKDISENNRRAKQMVVSFIQDFDGDEISSSRSGPLASYEKEALVKNSLELIKANTKQFFKQGSNSVINNPLKFLGISVGKFETISNAQSKLEEMFANQAAKKKTDVQQNTNIKPVICEGPIEPTNNITEPCLDKKKSFMFNYLAGAATKKPSNESIEIKEQQNECSKEKSEVLGDNDESNSKIKNKNLEEQKQELKESTVKVINDTKCKGSNIDANKKEKSESSAKDTKKSFFFKVLQQKNEMKNISNSTEKNEDRDDDLQQLEKEIELVESEVIQSVEMENSGDCRFISESSALTDPKESLPCSTFISSDSPLNALKRKHTDDDSTHQHTENSNFNYTAYYAEFAVPELRPELLELKVCEICKANIPSDERSLQMHQDHHIAQQLSTQQREEYRQEIAAKRASTIKSPPKSSSHKKSKKTSCNTSDITKFLRQTAESVNPLKSSSNFEELDCSSSHLFASSTDVTTICPECKTSVPITEMDEHKDYHIAKNLQRKLNQLEVRTVAITTKKPSQSSGQRKKLNNSMSQLNASKSPMPASKPITQFFSQPNC